MLMASPSFTIPPRNGFRASAATALWLKARARELLSGVLPDSITLFVHKEHVRKATYGYFNQIFVRPGRGT